MTAERATVILPPSEKLTKNGKGTQRRGAPRESQRNKAVTLIKWYLNSTLSSYIQLHDCLLAYNPQFALNKNFHFFLRLTIFKFYFIYLFLAALGLRCCARAFSSCSKRGLLFVEVHGLLMAVASRCGAQALGVACGHMGSVVVARRL